MMASREIQDGVQDDRQIRKSNLFAIYAILEMQIKAIQVFVHYLMQKG